MKLLKVFAVLFVATLALGRINLVSAYTTAKPFNNLKADFLGDPHYTPLYTKRTLDIEETLKKVNLYEEKDKLYPKYSLRMKQKLGIAQVLMENPKIIILDEPFNGLDDNSAEKIRKLLLEEKKLGKLIIIATHLKDDIEKFCDIVFKFDSGKIV